MKKKPSALIFMLVLCTLAALILSSMSDLLGPLQENKKQAYTKKQILLCANLDASGNTKDILEQFNTHLKVRLTDANGNILTFKEANIDEKSYIKQYQKVGFYKAAQKLFYIIQSKDGVFEGFVIPIDGSGLWGPIHGYIALEKDGTTIKGITFYDHMETPGLGAEISTKEWQKQFVNKSIHPSFEAVSLTSPPFSIYVVKDAEKMQQTLAEKNSSVDAITGASITSNGVQKAFEDCLKAYRPLILKLHEKYGKE